MTQVAILDYGLGNIRSVKKGLEKAGAKVIITSDYEEILSSDGAVLPGVGAFSEGMEQLKDMKAALFEFVEKRPVLGICLGMQMLLEISEEYGIHEGLGLVPGRVRGFEKKEGYKIPHMGWNNLTLTGSDPLFEGIKDETYVYFVHSYYADTTPEYTIAETDYICPFSSAVRNKNAWGTQFHPEKSGDAGLKILGNFIALAE